MSLNKVKMISAYFENFIGLYNGLDKKKVFLDFSKLLDKDIIVIIGGNGYGKTTLASILHPLVGTTDKRTKYIRKDKIGQKIICYERLDGIKYECKIVYTPTKTGHSSKGYVKKFIGDEVLELNPNGNITSYKDVLFDEIGISDSILKLSSQNDTMKGLVDMTSSMRKENMVQFLPDDVHLVYYKIVDKHYKEMRSRLNVIIDNVGKMHTEDELKLHLEKVTEKINELVNKRDKSIKKISEYETRIKVFEESGDMSKTFKKLEKDTKKLYTEINVLEDNIKDITVRVKEQINGDVTVENIEKALTGIEMNLNETEKLISMLESNSTRNKRKRNELADLIIEKEEFLKDISSDATMAELKDMLKDYKDRFKDLDEVLSSLDSNLTKDILLTGYEIVRNFRDGISGILDVDNKEYIKRAIKDFEDPHEENLLMSLYEKKKKNEDIGNKINMKLNELNSQSYLKDVLDKRPKECTIDSCSFIQDAWKWKEIAKEIDKYNDILDESNKAGDSLYTKIEESEGVMNVIKYIKKLISYLELNKNIINKLPFSKKYNTQENLLKCIKKGDLLFDCDDFEDFINVLEDKDEWNNLKMYKIPSLKKEIELMEREGKMIDNSKEDLTRMQKEMKDIRSQMEMENTQLLNLIKGRKIKTNIKERLEELYNDKNESIEKKSEYTTSVEELKDLHEKIEKMDKLSLKMKEKKIKVKEIDKVLNPLTQQRDLAKLELMKLVEYKDELSILEDEMDILEAIRESLSTKKGIPLELMGMYIDNMRINANSLLSSTFAGELYLEEFELNDKEFTIPFRKGRGQSPDISDASSAERSFISLCLTFAIIEDIVSTYGIMLLDEIDKGFSEGNKGNFVNILGRQIKRVGITQTFIVTHNREYYENYDLGFILFPEHGLTNYDDDDVIKVYSSESDFTPVSL